MRRIRVAVPVDTLAHRIERLAGFAGFTAALIATSFALPDTLSYVVGNQLRPAPVSERLMVVEFDDLYAATRPPEALHADLLNVLRRVRAARPAVVALDASIVPASAAEATRLADSLQADRASGCVVLPARVVENSGVATVVQVPARPGLFSGYVLQPGVQTEREAGLHRRMRRVVQEGYGSIEGVASFPDVVAQVCAPASAPWSPAQRIRYRGPLSVESGFARVSSADVLAGEIPDEWLAGRVILVGRNLSAGEGQPLYSTPYGLRGSLMVQANAVNARLTGTHWVQAPWWGGIGVALGLLVCICIPVFLRGFTAWAPLGGALVLLASHAAFIAAGSVLPTAFSFRVWLWASVLTYLLAPRGRRYRWAEPPEASSEVAGGRLADPAAEPVLVAP